MHLVFTLNIFYRSSRELLQHFRFEKHALPAWSVWRMKKYMLPFFLLTFNHFLYNTLTHRTLAPLLFFGLFRRHVSTSSYKCFYFEATATLSKYERKQKLYLWGPEGTRELPPIPEVRDSWRVKWITERLAMTCPCPATRLEWELVMTPTRTLSWCW